MKKCASISSDKMAIRAVSYDFIRDKNGKIFICPTDLVRHYGDNWLDYADECVDADMVDQDAEDRQIKQ